MQRPSTDRLKSQYESVQATRPHAKPPSQSWGPTGTRTVETQPQVGQALNTSADRTNPRTPPQNGSHRGSPEQQPARQPRASPHAKRRRLHNTGHTLNAEKTQVGNTYVQAPTRTEQNDSNGLLTKSKLGQTCNQTAAQNTRRQRR